MESLATPQEADLDDEQIRILLASPRYLLEREASAERSQICHSGGEGFDVKFISKSELFRHRETSGMALTPEKNGTRLIFAKESNLLMFKEVMNRFPEMPQNLFLKEIEITSFLKRDLN